MTNKNEDVVYFSINNWFQGRDYPVGNIFEIWVGLNSPLSDDAWCKENKICVECGSIDMSQNWCVSAPRSFVEKYCPELLTDEEYSYDIIRYYRSEEIKETINMNAIITVVGKDRVGIIAAICVKLAEFNVNVLDISQTILQNNFTMVMAVDVSQISVSFAQVADALKELGKEMELSINIQREEIFDAMHTI